MKMRLSLPFCALCIVLIAFSVIPAKAACDWTAVKGEIAQVLDGPSKDAFLKEVHAGRDPFEAIEKLVDEASRARLRECAYEAGDYLSDRGYPPAH